MPLIDPSNFEIIAPFSAYTGKNLQTLVEPDKTLTLDLNHFRSLEAHVQRIQKNIIDEVSLSSMQRSKWQTRSSTLKINQMVLIRDDRVKSVYWKLARIHLFLIDKTGDVRIVKVIRPVYPNENYPNGPNASNKNRIETRHVTQLALLPVDIDEAENLNLNDFSLARQQESPAESEFHQAQEEAIEKSHEPIVIQQYKDKDSIWYLVDTRKKR